MYSHLGRKTEVFGHIFYDFYTSPLDIMVEDFKETFDPTDGHIRPGPPKPFKPPTDMLDKLKQSTTEDQPPVDTSNFKEYLTQMSMYYRTNHLLLMVGAKENFEKSEYYFQ